MGMMSLTVLQTILSSNDLINQKFPHYRYNFYSIFQSHIAVPISILLINSYSKCLNLNSRIYVSLILASVFLDFMIVFTYFGGNSVFSFLGLMIMGIMANIFEYFFQWTSLNILSVYYSSNVSFYYAGTGCSSL